MLSDSLTQLDSTTLPAGKTIAFNLNDTARLADTKKNPISIKEDVDYKSVILSFFRCNAQPESAFASHSKSTTL
jgi:hypothetical protein